MNLASPGIFISIPSARSAFFLPLCCDNYSMGAMR
ncbi:hypothetical protein CKO_03251 [Citrobacter koseri ATCC BAA-895]|uniref:Uncharacterized protein n=1 Tax=Citrobacter koseri (strain ATCC BAA-895 / CDC 4225-83 / SGSC4696) TaxID=290338 RepID=A8ALH2_CITK8|nr:hypothetical protein CKO_03251 [Citrobacter koseri ATCC BAA-895]